MNSYETMVRALRELSDRCDGAREEDTVGFNGPDSKRGKVLAAMSELGRLSEEDQEWAIGILQKYRRQLGEYGIDSLPTVGEYVLEQSGDAVTLEDLFAKTGKLYRRVPVAIKAADDRSAALVLFSGPSLIENKDLLKAKVPGRDRKFNKLTSAWSVDAKWIPLLLELYPDAWVQDVVRKAAELMRDMPKPKVVETEPVAAKMVVAIEGDRITMRTPFYRQDWHAACKACGRYYPDKRNGGKGKHWYSYVENALGVVEAMSGVADVDISPGIFDLADSKKKLAEISNASSAELIVPIDFPEGLELLPYQKAGVNFLLETNGRAIVGDDMGLGKTIQAIAYLQAESTLRPALVVCPATVKLNWKNEVEKWLTAGNRVRVLEGRKGEKLEEGEADIYVINYDILHNTREGEIAWGKALLDVGVKVAVFDEAHRVSNPKSLRGQAAKEIAEEIDHVIFLTGTPIQNRPKELYPLLNMVSPRAWSSFFEYGKRYCNGHNMGHGWDFNGASNLGELFEKTRPYMVRRRKVDVLKDLPAKRRVDLVVDPTAKNRKRYVSAREEALEKIRQGDANHLLLS